MGNQEVKESKLYNIPYYSYLNQISEVVGKLTKNSVRDKNTQIMQKNRFYLMKVVFQP